MGILTQARTKLLLFGEHAVVLGYPALGLTLPWLFTLKEYGPSVKWEIEGVEDKHRQGVLQVLDTLSRRSGCLAPRRLTLTCDVPPESGFGSSAALCAAAVRFFFPEKALTEQWKLAQEAENLFHGLSSGVDTALALREGAWLFEPQKGGLPNLTPVLSPLPALVVGSLPRLESAKDLILKVYGKAQADDSVRSALAELGKAAVLALDFLGQPNAAQKIGALASSCQERLSFLGLGHPEADRILAVGESRGSLGGKLSGAGAGGAFWMAAESESAARGIAEAVIQAMAARPSFRWLVPPAVV